MQFRTGNYSSRNPVDEDVDQGSMLDDTKKALRQSCVVEVRHDWIFITALQSCYYHSVVAIHKNTVAIGDVTGCVTFITLPEKMDFTRQKKGGRPLRV
jgi:hypothetical protein